MKTINKCLTILIILIISISCAKEEMVAVDPGFILSYQRDGKTDASVGSTFYVIPTGSGEFLTLFSGTEGHVWGKPGAKGVDFNKADSVGLQYNDAGKYILTVVSTSSGNFGKEISRDAKSIEINALDYRNTFTVFNVNGVDGVISTDNLISFSIPDITADYNFIATFGVKSDLSKVYIDGVEQISGETVNDFSQDVVYTIVSSQGTENKYTVKFTAYPSSAEKKLTKFALGYGGNNEIGEIDETNKTIRLIANYGTNLTSVRLVLESSYASKIYLNNILYSDKKNYNLSATGINSVKVIAENNSEVEYAIIASSESPVSAFTFSGLYPEPQGVIDVSAKTITINVLKGTNVAQLVAKWIGSVGKVTIGTTTQTNGVTANNFTNPVTYKFYKGTSAGDSYIVTVNIVD